MVPKSSSQATMPSGQPERSEKVHKSNKEKKRKRDHGEDGLRHKSKKHRSDKAEQEQEQTVDSSTKQPEESPFHMQTSSLYLPLAPVSQKLPLEGMCAEHLSPLILSYYPPFNGVVLSYSNPRISEQPFHDDGSEVLLQCIDEYGASWAWVTAEFLLFKPLRAGQLEGYINLQNEGHLGIVCWNMFNASIERKRLPRDWKWVSAEDLNISNESETAAGNANYAEEGVGYYVDGEGKKIEGIVKFRVKDIESSPDSERGFLTIEGTMLETDEENELLEQESLSLLNNKSTAGRRLGGARALGATSLGIPAESDDMGLEGGTKKHRRAY